MSVLKESLWWSPAHSLRALLIVAWWSIFNSLLVVFEARPERNGGRGGLFWSAYRASAGGTSRLVGDGAVHFVS